MTKMGEGALSFVHPAPFHLPAFPVSVVPGLPPMCPRYTAFCCLATCLFLDFSNHLKVLVAATAGKPGCTSRSCCCQARSRNKPKNEAQVFFLTLRTHSGSWKVLPCSPGSLTYTGLLTSCVCSSLCPGALNMSLWSLLLLELEAHCPFVHTVTPYPCVSLWVSMAAPASLWAPPA